jgi:protoporphyrinogen IX oxidase
MLYILALHIIFVVTWFAGLFYTVRLFIYHVEADKKPEPDRSILIRQFQIMQRRLWYGITWPSAILTFIFGPWLWLVYFRHYTFEAFFLLKLCFVFGLAIYHLQCHVMFRQLQNNVIRYSSIKLRIWNEVASIFLVLIVFVIVLKQNNDYVWIALGSILLATALYIGILVYRKSREKEESSEKKKEPPTSMPPPLP